ncbi:hypothetical protein CTI12_AA196400 [Artemisia annua]|uniref:Uncharacterized protein n=1 Tax=Artemisia annua TaxID=35608 RepID=A0A2U1P458_ARTAN|nr:hypothetical protein CTI12_AA196400 [Artemisia annua]
MEYYQFKNGIFTLGVVWLMRTSREDLLRRKCTVLFVLMVTVRPADCPLAYFFPSEPPFRDESLAKAIKLFSGMKMEEVMRRMSDAYISGGVDAEKALLESWTVEYEAIQKDPIARLPGIATNVSEKLKWYSQHFGPLPILSSVQEEGVSHPV